MNRIFREIGEKEIILFLDYDGTLVPIAQTPQKAVLPRAVKRTLAGLSRIKDVKVVVISGRSLKDVRRMVGLNNIIYAGNHGLEMRGAGVVFDHPTSSASRKAIDTICSSLRSELSALKGVLIEDKGKTLSIHYRLAGKKESSKIKEMISKAVSASVKRHLVRITDGKKVVEIRPPVYWDKGNAVAWLLKKLAKGPKAGRTLPIYIGDDKTDEDAFKALRRKGLTVHVGSRADTNARFKIKDAKTAHEFLKKLLAVKRSG